jgi:hypothetical protein
MLKISLLFGLPIFLIASPAGAVSIVTYNLTGAAGNQGTQAPSATEPNITGVPISRGPSVAPAAGGNSFNSNGWDSTSADDYLQLGFTVAPGFTVNLNNLSIGTQSSGTGPGTIGLFSSVDNFATALTSISQASGGNLVSSVYSLNTLTNLTGTINFRFLEIGNTSANGVGTTAAGGTFRLANNTSTSNIVFDGTVQAVPFEFSPLIGVAGLGAVFVTKKKLKKAK